MKSWKFVLLSFWVILLIFPYLIGSIQSDNTLVFGGFLLNPIDGYSYLAKMQQGYFGNWFFQLPFTAEFNGKALLFIFYIFLGQIARLFSLNLIFVFHFFRIFFAIWLFFTLDRFLTIFFDQNNLIWKFAFLTLLLGGGLGWLYLISGNLPADFWVAEAFPFLSALTNPHFTLTLTMMLIGYICAVSRSVGVIRGISIFLVGFLLSIISPFSALITGFIFLFYFLIDKNHKLRTRFIKLGLYFFGSAPMSIYQFVVVRNDPVLSLWNDQNITPAPSPGNFIFSFLPFLIGIPLIFYLWFHNKKQKFELQIYGLFVWVGVAILMLFLPIGLQRRFLVGFYIPIVVMFYISLSYLIQNYPKLFKIKKNLAVSIFLLALPSILFVYSGSILALFDKNEKLFIPEPLYHSGEWIRKNIPPGSVFLSSEESGLILPSLSYIKTVLGHPYETVDYTETLARVDNFWNAKMNLEQQNKFIESTHTEYIYYGVFEKKYILPPIIEEFPLVYDSGPIKIFKVE